jgi:uncharacterized protein (TIGR00661 family)
MDSGSLRVAFLVQGEGRGHLSQALALREMLEARGHRVVGVLAGTSERRPLPSYFAQGMGMEPLCFPSPTTVPGRRGTGVSMPRTVAYNVRRLSAYGRAIPGIRRALVQMAPDLVVNLYDALGGLATASPDFQGVPVVAVGHQYLLGHPGAPHPPFRPLQLLTFRTLNRLSAPPGVPRLALSFRRLPEEGGSQTRVVPPLLRRRVLEATPEPGEHLLVYILNHGYGEAVARWHARHPEVVIHGFWDRPGAPMEERVRTNLTFHRLSDTRFLELMRSCRGFVGTAGFESVAEALWLGKPVMVVPTGNQVEQAWNAREAVAAGAGISADEFELTPFLEYLPRHRDISRGYRKWVRKGHRRIVSLLEGAARARRGPQALEGIHASP